MRARITEISYKDAAYPIRNTLIGKEGVFDVFLEKGGWTGGYFTFDVPLRFLGNNHDTPGLVLYQIRYHNLDNSLPTKIGFFKLWYLTIRASLRHKGWIR